MGALGPVLDDAHRAARLGLDGADEPGDLLGGLLTVFGQLAHLLSHHGKTASLLAGARRFDGGIESEQVGLLSDPGDRLHDLPDLPGLRRQLTDGPADRFG